MSTFLAHPEHYFWGRIMLLVLFSLSVGLPLLVAYRESRAK